MSVFAQKPVPQGKPTPFHVRDGLQNRRDAAWRTIVLNKQQENKYDHAVGPSLSSPCTTDGSVTR